VARIGSAHHGTRRTRTTQPAVCGAGLRGGGRFGGLGGRAAGAVSAAGPPNISSSRPPELAVAQVTGPRPAAAELSR
jgi:hypothetical protein